MIDKAARIVLWVVAVVVMSYTAADVWLALTTGRFDEASRRTQDVALGALIAIIAQTGRHPSGGSPVGPVTGDGTQINLPTQ